MQDNFTKTVMVVDDDKDTADVFAEYLSMYNFSVLGVAHDGRSAFEMYQKLQPEIVFMDLMMPEYDGLYGLEMMKKFNPDTKVVMVTADVTDSSKNKMLALGVDAIIYKPFEIEEIFLTLKKIIEVPAL